MYHVDFDPSRFEERGSIQVQEGSTGPSTAAYVASLVPEVISKLSAVHKSTDLVRSIAIKFVESFGLDPILAAQKHIEYVLSPPPVIRKDSDPARRIEGTTVGADRPDKRSDIRWDLNLCERAARESLQLIESPMKRSAVLRRCVTVLEGANECDADYDRHALVLSLYHADLSLVVAKDPNIRDLDTAAFEEELEFIERRRDALAILSSYFQGEQTVHRPPFPKFFIPLPVPFNADQRNSESLTFDILGTSDGPGRAAFDPLEPLQGFLSLGMDDAATKALAPLSIPLGLAHGSIHVRCLIERFRRSNNDNATLPSFEHGVLPVLNRLKNSTDQCRLSEWCAAFYDDLDSQKLQCLDHGLRYAMAASSEVEKRLQYKSKSDGSSLATDERRALDAVKRLSDMHSTLSDRLEVNGILSSATIGMSQQFSSVEKMVRDLTDRLQESFWESTDSSPEKFVEKLLVEASLLASNACLEQDICFSVSQFRHMASVVHQACKRIADQYSHVHPGDISRRLARRWLVHGEELSMVSEELKKVRSTEDLVDRSKVDMSISVSAEEDATVDFVMDLNEDKAVWSDDIASSGHQKSVEPTSVSMEEEPSALKPDGSAREASELECTKVSLRVAFVMSFAEGYHKSQLGDPNEEENMSSTRANSEANSTFRLKKSRPGLLSRISTKDTSTRSSVTAHARELLRIVFAKSGEPKTDPTVSFMSTEASSFAVDEKSSESNNKTLTFAMRYRALRTAAVLCPQVALENVVAEEGYINTSEAAEFSLKKCGFGAFVAKEIEEMGVPLPHSDLVQLSTMHFPSYARALWRHHRGGDIKGKRGRLLLLLLEMSLRDSADIELASTLLTEMNKLQLPRTLLLGCECIARCKGSTRVASQSTNALLLDDNETVSNAVFTAANLVLSQVHRGILSLPDGNSRQDLDKGLDTVKRIGRLVETFSDCETGQDQLCQFVKVLEGLITILDKNKDPLCHCLAEIALSAVHCISNVEMRRESFDRLAQLIPGGQGDIQHTGGSATTGMARDSTEPASALFALVSRTEASYDPCITIASAKE